MLIKGRPEASLQGIGQDRIATIGEQLIVSCVSIGATQTPNLTLHVNDQKWENIYGGRITQEHVTTSRHSRHNNQGIAVVGYIDTVTDRFFNHGNTLSVECKAWYGDQMFKKTELNLRKGNSRSARRPNYQSSYPSTFIQNQNPRTPRTHQLNSNTGYLRYLKPI